MRSEIRECVESILKEDEVARANDNYLIWKVYERFGWATNLEDIAKTTENRFESIRRMRAKIQEVNPMLRPSVQVSKRRKALEEKIKNEMRGF